MKTIFKVRIHFFFYIIFLISIFTGVFKDFISITLIVAFHEMGHIIFSQIFNWKIEEIVMIPFGFITIFNNKINGSILEEFIVTISGILFQTILIFIIKNPVINRYNLIILLFNLIPIYPLDGSKLLNQLCTLLLPFKLSHFILIIISFIFVPVVILYTRFNLMIIVIMILYIIKIIEELKNHNYIFNKFLFERYLYKIKFKRKKTIIGIKIHKMYRNYTHIFKSENININEYEILERMFDR